MKHWMEKQHLALLLGPCRTQRQAQELISGPNLITGADYCPLIRHNPWLLLACSLDITPWEYICI